MKKMLFMVLFVVVFSIPAKSAEVFYRVNPLDSGEDAWRITQSNKWVRSGWGPEYTSVNKQNSVSHFDLEHDREIPPSGTDPQIWEITTLTNYTDGDLFYISIPIPNEWHSRIDEGNCYIGGGIYVNSEERDPYDGIDHRMWILTPDNFIDLRGEMAQGWGTVFWHDQEINPIRVSPGTRHVNIGFTLSAPTINSSHGIVFHDSWIMFSDLWLSIEQDIVPVGQSSFSSFKAKY